MKLTAKVKLDTTDKERNALKRTLEMANAACNDISQVAWDTKTFRQFTLHKLVYYDIREAYPELSAQIVVRAISKVVDAYKKDRKVLRTFKPLGSIAFDARIVNWYTDKRQVSIWSVDGRIKHLGYLGGERQHELLKRQQGESDLCYIEGEFYLFATCEIDEPTEGDVTEFLGVDMGIVHPATDNDGNHYGTGIVMSVRKRRRKQRKRLQSKGTKAARRRLKKLSGKEQRFATHTNHVISKRIVELAQRTGRGISLENLKGIRDRVRLRKPQRTDLHSWSFYQLGEFLKYKARLAGVPLVFIDPRSTSRECPECGHISKSNRKSQAVFGCQSCGFAANADTVGATNISVRGLGAYKPSTFSDATTSPLATGA